MTNAKTPIFDFDGMTVKAKCVKCYDGDTVHLCFSYRKGPPMRHRCRLLGIDTPEMNSKDLLEKQAAVRARDELSSLILDKLVKVDLGKMDKYGRPLVTIYRGRKNVNQHLVDRKLAVRYDGSTKLSFRDWYQK